MRQAFRQITNGGASYEKCCRAGMWQIAAGLAMQIHCGRSGPDSLALGGLAFDR